MNQFGGDAHGENLYRKNLRTLLIGFPFSSNMVHSIKSWELLEL
ncbi:hypothetical protein BLGI_3058 [Brevibacillus laterosporus GI-9]|nr:hypothetical protein BLGI_3058 [Brevibacillus laterosporus GI-9]